MAVTLTVQELQAALRLGNTAEETAEVARLLAYATEAVVKHVPNAPDVAHNEATRRLGSYLFDMPEAGRGDSYANAMRSSGAARMLLPYRVHRLGLPEAIGSVKMENNLLQQSPFTVTNVPSDIAAAYPAGRYRAEFSSPGAGHGVYWASGPQPPASDNGYFLISFSGAIRSFDFESGSSTWVKSTVADITLTLAVARYPG